MTCKSRGFTLIELIIAIVIISMAIAPLAFMLGNVIDMTIRPEFTHVATQLAEQELEKIAVARFSQVNDQAQTAYTGSLAKYSYEIQVDPVPAGLASDVNMLQYKQVKIIIHHDSLGSLTISTVVTNNP